MPSPVQRSWSIQTFTRYFRPLFLARFVEGFSRTSFPVLVCDKSLPPFPMIPRARRAFDSSARFFACPGRRLNFVSYAAFFARDAALLL